MIHPNMTQLLYSIVVAPEKFSKCWIDRTYDANKQLTIQWTRGGLLLHPIWPDETYRHMVAPTIVVTGIDGYDIDDTYYAVQSRVTVVTLLLSTSSVTFFNYSDTPATLTETYPSNMTAIIEA